MKVKKKTYIVEYWDCGNEEHKHAKQPVAQNCQDKRIRSNAYRQAKLDRGAAWEKKREALIEKHGSVHNAVIDKYRECGKLGETAKYTGFTSWRVKQILAKNSDRTSGFSDR